MLFDGIKLVEGSEVQNLVVDTGSTFPTTPNSGEMFYINDTTGGQIVGLYLYEGAGWVRQMQAGDSISDLLPSITTAATYRSVTVDDTGRVTAGTNPTTIAGYGITDAQPLDGDLTAIGALAGTTGLLRKTAANTWTLDTGSYITGNQTITATGDVTGSGTTTLALTLGTTGVAAGSYGTANSVPTISVDSKGRVTTASNTSIAIDATAVTSGSFANARIAQSSVTQFQSALTIAESQITQGTILARNAVDETISGNWTFSYPVTGATPTSGSHLTTKDYVDNIAAGVNPKVAAQVTTTGSNITLSGLQTIDGYTTLAGDRVLVKDQTTGSQNGIYVAASGAWTRATDFDGSPANEVVTGDLVYVEYGTTNGNSSWILVTPGTITVGTTAMTFSVFSRPGDFTVGGGLVKVGNQFSVGTGSSSRIVVNTSSIDLATTGVTAGTFAQTTVDAYGRVTSGSATLPWTSVASTPTTIAGYGITDAQGLNSTLTALAGLSGNGIIAKTGSGAATTRQITVSGVGLSITNGDGVSADPTITSNATSSSVASTIVARDSSGNFSAGTITATLSGNASTATSWLTGRTISITGDATGVSGNFDGSTNASIAIGLATVNSNVGSFGSSSAIPTFTVNAKGLITAASSTTLTSSNVTEGTNLYFTTARAQAAISVSGTGLSYSSGVITSNATSTNTGSTIVSRDGSGNFVAGTITAALSGNATTATTATNIAGGAAGSIPYQTASGATSLLASATGVLVGGTTPSYSTTPTLTGTNFTGIPAAAVTGTAWTQSSLTNLNQLTNGPGYITASASVSGNASTATALQTARTIAISGDVTGTATSFDGSANISIASSISAATITGKALTGYVSGAGTIAATDTILSAIQKLNGNLTNLSTAVSGALVFQGTWNALTNSPAITSGSGTKGYYYKVATAGTTTVDGISQWNIGDMIVFNGTTWDKIDGVSTEVTSVAGRVGAVTLSQADISGLTTSSSPTFAAVTAGTFTGALSGNATTATTAGTVTTAAQPNITSVGTLTGLTVAGSGGATITVGGGSSNTLYTDATNTALRAYGSSGAVYLQNSTGSGTFAYFNSTGANVTGTVIATAFTGAGTGLTGTASSLSIGGNAATSSSATVAASISNEGNVTANTTGTFPATGLTLASIYSNGYPIPYGNVITVTGGGAGQLALGWAGTTGGYAPIYYRSLRDSAMGTNGWSAWAELLDSSNYTGYAPSLTGSGASGTWGINISGNAATATSATSATSATYAGYLNNANAYTNGTDGWWRSTGAAGWYNATYSTGIYSQQAGLVETYNSASFRANGNLIATGNVVYSTATGIAAGGTTQSGATTISKDINVVSTVAASSGVVFSALTAGTQQVVINAGANTLTVYPPSGAQIDSLGANVGFSLPVGGKIMFIAVSTTQMYTLNATYA